MHQNLIPLPVAVPLLVAALLTALATKLPRRASDTISILTAAAMVVVSGLLLAGSSRHTLVYWFGGWRPHGGMAPGIAFVADPIGAGIATLVAVLAMAAFLYAWRYFEAVGTIFQALMLVFLGAMAGFCLAGDLFTLFVFFELMGIAAYALTAYKSEESSLEGGLVFAITNAIGGYLFLLGIGLVYGRTGALNLAQVGQALAGKPADALVIAAFVLLMTGLLVKGAIVPFHFWLSDAHAVAPTPVCVLFSGVMVGLGVFGAARIYWTVFDGAMAPHAADLRPILVGAGTLTVLVGGVMCVLQRHIKRLLAFSTISHIGMVLCGIGLLEPKALGGAMIYLVGHGLVKAVLFMASGILLHRFSSVDEMELRGAGRVLPFTGALMVIAALGLAGVPPFGTYLGKSGMEEAADALRYPWLPYVFLVGSALTAGAVLRVVGRVFLGWGPAEGVEAGAPTEREKPETDTAHQRTPALMMVTPVIIVLASLVLGAVPGLKGHAEAAADAFHDRPAFAAAVLGNGTQAIPAPPPPAGSPLKGVLFGLAAGALSFAVAGAGLFAGRSVPAKGDTSAAWPPVRVLQSLHSGHVGDYTAWLVAGTAALGALCLALR